MKNIFRLLLAAVAVFCTSALYGQQMIAVINTQELVEVMPETVEAQAQLETAAQEFTATLEAIQVEFNTKFTEYQRVQSTLTDAIRQMREKEISDLRTRYNELEQAAQRDMETLQRQLMEPIFAKIDATVDKVARDNGFATVFDTSTGVTVFVDETKVTNLLPLVKRELGIE